MDLGYDPSVDDQWFYKNMRLGNALHHAINAGAVESARFLLENVVDTHGALQKAEQRRQSNHSLSLDNGGMVEMIKQYM